MKTLVVFIAIIAVFFSGAYALSDRQEPSTADRSKRPSIIADREEDALRRLFDLGQVEVAEILPVSPSALQPPAPENESSAPPIINPALPEPPGATPEPGKNAEMPEVINPETSASSMDTLQSRGEEPPAAGSLTASPFPSPKTSKYSSSCVDVSDAAGSVAEGGSSVIVRKQNWRYDIIFDLQDCSASPASEVVIIESLLCEGGHIQIEGRICTVGAPDSREK